METSLTLPFSVDSYGKISVTTDYAKIWADRVRAVIGTNIQERVMAPDFGTRIASAVYNNQNEAVNTIKTEVSSAFQTQLPLLKLSSIDVQNDTSTGTLSVVIVYNLPNLKTVETTVAIAYIDKTNPIYEENL